MKEALTLFTQIKKEIFLKNFNLINIPLSVSSQEENIESDQNFEKLVHLLNQLENDMDSRCSIIIFAKKKEQKDHKIQ